MNQIQVSGTWDVSLLKFGFANACKVISLRIDPAIHRAIENAQRRIVQMEFEPIVEREPKVMDARIFLDKPMGLSSHRSLKERS